MKNNYSKYYLSIVTITFNNCKGLKKTIDSINNQNNNNIEHIIIDNLSNDRTEDLINEYISKKHKETKISYIREKDYGIADGMNKGLSFAEGSHILFLNAGDKFIDKNGIYYIYESINLFPKKSLYLFSVLMESNNKIIKKLNLPINIFSMFISNFIHHQGAVYDLNFINNNKHKFNLKFSNLGCDYFFNLKLFNFQRFSIIDLREKYILTLMEGEGISIKNSQQNFFNQHLIRLYIFGRICFLPSILIFYLLKFKVYKIIKFIF